MKNLFYMFLFAFFVNYSTPANSQSVTPPAPTPQNTATVNIVGNNQNVILNQTGADHSAILNLTGDGINVNVTQLGPTPKSFSLDVLCFTSCSTPYVVTQY